uniref:Uncharacterized protein n=1 Tax=Rhizophora mucronata TaxID=61149 RepID=A0A2P2IXK1_RHIMU
MAFSEIVFKWVFARFCPPVCFLSLLAEKGFGFVFSNSLGLVFCSCNSVFLAIAAYKGLGFSMESMRHAISQIKQ